MFQICYKWCPIYMMEYFFMGMQSTQRSKGMNAFVKSKVKRCCTLYEFAGTLKPCYSHKVTMRCNCTTMISMSTFTYNCVAHQEALLHIYTSEVFLMYQNQVQWSLYYFIKLPNNVSYLIYHIVLQLSSISYFLIFSMQQLLLSCWIIHSDYLSKNKVQ